MGHKHLHELLQEDQEPFHLKNFIADRRSLLKSTSAGAGSEKTALVLQTPKPIIKSTSSRSFCINHVCLFSSYDSPGFKTSPFLDFPTRESKSPCNNATVFLHIPARTAAMLLDAATRVQKQKPKTGSKPKQIRFGLLGSFLQRLKDRSTRTKRREIEPATRFVNGDWSEKPSALETSCSSRSVHEFEENECFCSNFASPFHFSLQRSPSPTRRRPDSLLPAESPSRHFQQEKESYEVGCDEVTNRQNDDVKEQCSPVSVLDPLFDDDEEERDGGVTKEDNYDIDRSYANVQRAKHQLLQKLKRFERLAELDPIQLENNMLEQLYNEDEDVLAHEDVTSEKCFSEIVSHLGVEKIPRYMKKLVFDLIEEENGKEEREMVVQRVCNRLYLWKVVDMNTIDMIVETDFKSEVWRCCDKETIRNMGIDVGRAILELLVEELAQELVYDF